MHKVILHPSSHQCNITSPEGNSSKWLLPCHILYLQVPLVPNTQRNYIIACNIMEQQLIIRMHRYPLLAPL